MTFRRPVAALLSAVALCAAPAALALTVPWAASAETAGTPAGSGAVGGFLDVGAEHVCAVQHDRTIRCWGEGSSGRLGGGQTDDRLATAGSSATSLAPGTVASVASGDSHSCALITSGAVRCWGQSGSGQLGGGTRDNRLDGTVGPLSGTDDATTVPLGGAAVAITAGGEFSCALMSGSGAVRCWGDGGNGRLGSGDTGNRLDGLPDGPSDDASTVPLGGAAVAITAGDAHACALMAGGTVRCWGSGANGRLGSGATDDRLDGVVDATTHTDAASTVPLSAPATAISAGGAHTCALLSTGDVACWGAGGSGQLGAGRTDGDRLDGVKTTSGESGKPATDDASIVPIKPVGTAANKVATTPNIPAIAIAAGGSHTCAIVNTGDVRCWGLGSDGQLGQGAKTSRLENNFTAVADAATRVGGGPTGTGPGLGAPAISISAGIASTCAELSNGSVRCWGNGGNGRLGTGATDDRLDGVVDPGATSDDASLVPIGILPINQSDLTIDPATITPAPSDPLKATVTPTPAPTPTPVPRAPIPALSYSLRMSGKKIKVAALVAPAKAGTCAKSVSSRVVQGKKVLARASLKLEKKGVNCRASGTIKLKKTPKTKTGITVVVSGKGLTGRVLALKTS